MITRRPMGPGYGSPESLLGGEDVNHKNSHSPTLKSILGITQIINKAYQVTKFNQIILICTMSDLFTQPKRPGVCIMSNILIA